MPKLNSILLIDDDETTNFINKMVIEEMGVARKLHIAKNGQEGLQRLQQANELEEGPELILLDLKMPVMDGFQFLESFHNTQPTQASKVVVVVLSTSVHITDMERVKSMGIQDFLQKPLTAEQIQGVIDKHFSSACP